MMFLAGADRPTMILLLTEQDVNDMRGGRTKFVNKMATKGALFNEVVLSVHKNQAEIEGMLKQAGHGKLLQGMPSPVPEPEDAVCEGCKGIMRAYLLLEKNCIACWREKALANKG